jgi:hypothetical protein
MVIKNTSSTTINNNSIGQFFTPGYIAEFMVKNIISYVKRPKNDFPTLKILEPSAGEGIFLKYLLKNNLSNITAYEMDEDLKEILLNSYPNIDFKFENFLGSKSKEKYDIIIGNPPYLGQNYNAEIFQQYIRRFPLCAKYFVGNMDLFYFFIHLGIEKLNPGGVLSFITTNYWITKSRKTGIKFLKPHVLGECFLLQYIDLSYLQLFDNAKGQQNCIFVLQKKNEDEKKQKINKKIEIIQFIENKGIYHNNKLANKKIFKNLTYGKFSSKIKKFTSAITNNDLKKDESWNLIYPKEVKYIVEKIENYCKGNTKSSLLKDYFLIRNGLILIKDSIFILNEGIDIKTKQNDIFIRINGEFLKLSEIEKSRLKKIYKSKSIKAYGYEKDKYTGYVIYFNKNEFKPHSNLERNHLIKDRYPLLSKYIRQYENELKDILINAKENPHDFYFPRRGAFIRQFDANSNEKLTDLEPLYDHGEKIFFKYISKDNTFGYSNTSYYATSDTYFLWPKYPENNVDYLFFLAYLNSSIVNFIYKAKNISIKRSKTKLEQGLPMPNLKNFKRGEKKAIIELIRMLTLHIIDDSDIKLRKNIENYIDKITPDNCFKAKIIEASRFHDRHYLKKAIDKLFFQLFELDEKLVANLLNEYYNH